MRAKVTGGSCERRSSPEKAFLLLVLLLIGGCSTYRPMPITSEAVRVGLTPPPMEEVRILAGKITHPLLKPLPFDDRDGLSPDEAAILAIIVNPTLRAARDLRGIASAQLQIAGILPNPQFSYTLETPVGGGTGEEVNAFGLGLNWGISSLFSRDAGIGAAKAASTSVNLEVAWQEWQVAESARSHAYRLALVKRQLVSAKEAEKAWTRLLEGVKEEVAMGLKTALDLATARRHLHEGRVLLQKVRSRVEQEKVSLNRALGIPPDTAITLERGVAPALKDIPPLLDLTEQAKNKRLDLLALKVGYQSQEERVREAVLSQFPGIHIGLIGGRDTDGVRTVGMGVTIALPIFNRNQGHIAEERATRKRLFDEYVARIFEARGDITSLAAAVMATKREIVGMEKALSALKKSVEEYRLAVERGEIEKFSYYEMIASLHEEEIKKIALEIRLVDLGIALEIASGRYGLVIDDGKEKASYGKKIGGRVSG